MVAARQGYLYLSRVLLEHKPNIDKVNSKCQNVVYMAVEGNDRHVVEFLLENEEFPRLLKCADLDGNRPIHKAAEIGNLEIVSAIVKASAGEGPMSCLVAPNMKGQTPAHIAAKFGHLNECVRLLLESDHGFELLKNKTGRGKRAMTPFRQMIRVLPGSITVTTSTLKQMVQCFASLADYFTFENVFELAIYSLAIATTVDTNGCMRRTGLREPWQWQTGTAGIVFAWIDLLMFFQRTTPIGIYLGIFGLILTNLANLAVVFSPFLVAFALAFHLLLGNQIRFNDMRNAFSSTVSMFSGEVGLADASHAMFNRYEPGASPEKLVYYATLSYLFFLTFVAFMSIALMNMLTGIAVGDVEAKKSQANLETVQQLTSTQGKRMELDEVLDKLREKVGALRVAFFMLSEAVAVLNRNAGSDEEESRSSDYDTDSYE
ncbi:hypothetical protein T265_07050 [Opisthorchis viverrini]|uniref:Ion transport domain-containing protein n=1 Tax=Opisthorchis viverrini TaxID=6198 RepID=A0A074ZE36_OPIVI|nr:hypothetical protein T265_07050 [Opisthorchis viverrini]KER25536.1 hypothetical protein T265_07050 [Opisthorchis viverrini]